MSIPPDADVPLIDVLNIDLLKVTAYPDYYTYMRVAKRRNMETGIHARLTLELLKAIDNQLYSEMARINSKIERVKSLEQNGGQLAEAFQKRSEEYENRLKAGNEKLNKLCKELQNFKASHNETSGDALREFEQEKQKFMAKLVEMRRKANDVLASLAGHIKEVNQGVGMRRMVHEDLQYRLALEGRTLSSHSLGHSSI